MLTLAGAVATCCSYTRTERFTYHVEGNAQGVTITYVNSQGDPETHSVDPLPWVLDVEVPQGTEVVVSAVAAGPGELRCGLSDFDPDESPPLVDSAVNDKVPLSIECSS